MWSCFFAPKGIVTDKDGFFSYALAAPERINYIGLAIFILAAIAFIVSRKTKLSVTAFCWGLFAFLLLCVVGWGAPENGMVLYTLYFSWAFCILLFYLILKLAHEKVVPVSIAVLAVALSMIYLNGKGIAEIIRFGIQYYPRS